MSMAFFNNTKRQHGVFVLVLLWSMGAWAGQVTKHVEVGTEPRHYHQVDESYYNSVFLGWGDDLLSDRISLSDAETADRRARKFAALGVRGVVYNGSHNRLSCQEEWENIKRYAKITTDACHRYGLKVIEHSNMSLAAYNSYTFMLEHLDWFQQDIRTGERSRWVCPNNDEFIQFYADYLVDYQRATDMDGYMLDELAMAGKNYCGCSYCRSLFLEMTGDAMPVWVGKDESFDSGLYRNKVRYSSKIAARALCKLMTALRSVRGDVMNMTYCSDFSDSSTVKRGLDLAHDAAMFSSFIGWECMINETLNGWKPFLRELKFRLGMANYYDFPVWSLNRQARSPGAIAFAWSLCQLGKHSIWGGIIAPPDDQLEAFGRYIRWPDFMPHRYARCLTDTAILLSNQTRFTNPDRNFYWKDVAGWAEMMIEGNRQFDTLLDGDLALAGRLKKYRVLLLPSVASLSDGQCRNLIEWVWQGGTVVFSTRASTCDEFGEVRRDFALGKEAGISLLESNRRGPFKIRGGAGKHGD